MRLIALLPICMLATLSCEQRGNEQLALTTLIFSDEVIASWGYRTLETGLFEQSDWEVDNFGKASIRYQSIKGLHELKDWENAYYRFVIQEETFATPAEASLRIERVREVPPSGHTKVTPHWTLRDGIASGRSAYIVSTDSTKFADEALPSLISNITNHLKTEAMADMPIHARNVPLAPHP